ncbi:hypothetical protein D3C83_228320 [compost metagenome]
MAEPKELMAIFRPLSSVKRASFGLATNRWLGRSISIPATLIANPRRLAVTTDCKIKL